MKIIYILNFTCRAVYAGLPFKLQAPSLSLHKWLESMDNLFPRLEDLSLFSTTVELIIVP